MTLSQTPMQAVLIDQATITANSTPIQLALFLPDGSPFAPLEALQGDSAYEVAVDNGFVGDEEAWLESLMAEVTPAAFQADTVAADLAALKVDFNLLLDKLIAAGLMEAA